RATLRHRPTSRRRSQPRGRRSDVDLSEDARPARLPRVAVLVTSADPTVRPLESLSPQQLLDVVVRARAVGSGPEWERAVAAWKQLVAREHPRVLQSVKAFRFPHQPTVRIPPDEYDDVAIKCWERAV